MYIVLPDAEVVELRTQASTPTTWAIIPGPQKVFRMSPTSQLPQAEVTPQSALH